MTSKTTHTPTPWTAKGHSIWGPPVTCKLDKKPHHEIVCNTMAGRDNGEDLANAAHIVKCVNQYDELVEALRSLINNNGTGAMEWAITQAKALLTRADQEG